MSATIARRRPRAAIGGSRAYQVFRFATIAVLLVAFLAPIAWMIIASLKTNIDIYNPAKTFVFTPSLSNYANVVEQQNFLWFMTNSFLVGVLSTALSLLIGLPAAYAVSRFSMRKSASWVLIARVIPGVCLLVPWYYVFASLRMVGGYGPLILAHMFVSLPLIVWVLISYFDNLPTELEEAGQVDGLTAIGAFLRIAVPLSRPGIATASILAFIFSWNNFMFALILANESTKTLPVAIFNFIGYASIDWGGLMAASTVITVPVMVISLLTQKYIVSGFTAGATKG